MVDPNAPILKYRVLLKKEFKDFDTVDEAWAYKGHIQETLGYAPYVHPIRKGGPEFPVFSKTNPNVA